MKCIYCGYEWQTDGADTACPQCGHAQSPVTEAEKNYVAGRVAEQETRYQNAIDLYALAADAGIAEAANGVCRCLKKSGMHESRPAFYVFWLSTWARMDAEGAFRYAIHLKTQKKEREALYYLGRAADMGHKNAHVLLALHYRRRGNPFAARHYLGAVADRSVLAGLLLFFLGKKKPAYPPEGQEHAGYEAELYRLAQYAEELSLANIAKSYYVSAAEMNYVPALTRLSDICMQAGSHTEGEAEGYLLRLGEAGHTDAYIKLGDYYKLGMIDGTPSMEKAYRMYLSAARAGDGRGMVLVGDACYHGKGTARDTFSALAWYDKAASAGNTIGAARADATREEGERLYREGGALLEKKRFDEAIPMLRTASELGNASAARTLGDCYLAGDGVKQSYKLAAKWYEFAIVLGNEVVKYRLGVLYAMNLGVRFDAKRAEQLLREAKEAGSEHAEKEILNLKKRRNARLSQRVYSTACTIYHRGDKTGAISFLVLAVKMGNARAAYMLGCMFDCGDGVTRDAFRAETYFAKAKEMGFDGNGNRYMGKFIKKMDK